MIKRPGNESYLRKMIEEERRAFSEVLDISASSTGPQASFQGDL